MTEVWKDFVDEKIQDRYMISNLGKVFDKKNEKVLNQNDNGAGYKNVPLRLKKLYC